MDVMTKRNVARVGWAGSTTFYDRLQRLCGPNGNRTIEREMERKVWHDSVE